MDKLEQYRQHIEQILTYYSQFKPLVGDTEKVLSFDRERDHYHLLSIGWHEYKRIYGCLIHVDIRNENCGFSMMAPRKA